MPEKRTLGTISIITDDDTGMYSIGEVDGGFHTQMLREHIQNYGPADLINHLAYMTTTVFEIARELQSEKSRAECTAEMRKRQ